MIIIGQPGDRTDDPNIMWPEGREQMGVGTLTIDTVESEETSPARDINFDPLVLPVGIAAFRRSLPERTVRSLFPIVYTASRREEEASAITTADVEK